MFEILGPNRDEAQSLPKRVKIDAKVYSFVTQALSMSFFLLLHFYSCHCRPVTELPKRSVQQMADQDQLELSDAELPRAGPTRLGDFLPDSS